MAADTLTEHRGRTQVLNKPSRTQCEYPDRISVEDDNLTVGDVHTTDVIGNAINIDVTESALTSAAVLV